MCVCVCVVCIYPLSCAHTKTFNTTSIDYTRCMPHGTHKYGMRHKLQSPGMSLRHWRCAGYGHGWDGWHTAARTFAQTNQSKFNEPAHTTQCATTACATILVRHRGVRVCVFRDMIHTRAQWAHSRDALTTACRAFLRMRQTSQHDCESKTEHSAQKPIAQADTNTHATEHERARLRRDGQSNMCTYQSGT